MPPKKQLGKKSRKRLPRSFLEKEPIHENARMFSSLTKEPRLWDPPNEPASVKDVQLSFNRLYANKQVYGEYLKKLKDITKRGTGFSAVWPQEHFTMNVVARRFSGKSWLVNKLVKEHLVSRRMDVKTGKLVKSKIQFFKKKILFSPTAWRDQSLDPNSFDEVYTSQDDLERYISKFKTATKDTEFDPALLVLDDTHTWLDYKSNSNVGWFVSVNRHYRQSMIIIGQNVKGFSPSIRNNGSDWIIFNCKLEEELKKISTAFGTNFDTYYQNVDWTNDYNFLYMSLRRGPTTFFFEGRPRDGQPHAPKELTFVQQDCSIRMRYLGSDKENVPSKNLFKKESVDTSRSLTHERGQVRDRPNDSGSLGSTKRSN